MKKNDRLLADVRKNLAAGGLSSRVEAECEGESIRLTGAVDTLDDYLAAGYAAAPFVHSRGVHGIINDVEIGDSGGGRRAPEESFRLPAVASLEEAGIFGRTADSRTEGGELAKKCRTAGGKIKKSGKPWFDVVIIGGGVIGAAAARELSRRDISIALIEKESDLALHASGRNDGMIHPGFAPKPGSLKAHYNTRGNALYKSITKELNIPFRREGSMILFASPLEKLLLPILKRRAAKNGVPGARYVSRREVARREPYVTEGQYGALYFPTAGQLSPYRLTIALAENAAENGAQIFRETEVAGFEMKGGSRPDGSRDGGRICRVKTNRGTVEAGLVINAAGAWADKIAEMAEDRFFSLHFRKGMDAILDTRTGDYQSIITGMPELLNFRKGSAQSRTKGGGLVPCVEGNILVGPTAVEVRGRDDYTTDALQMEQLLTRLSLNRALKLSDVIAYFAGVRACTWEEDFIVEKSRRVDNLIHLAGIQSPGLASAPAIAEDAARMAVDILERTRPVHHCRDFRPNRSATPRLNTICLEERKEIVRKDPSFGRVVCRCEGITEGEVREALRRPVPPLTVDGIKKRTRAGTGRCQGGFCTPRILEIMSDETGLPLTEIRKKGEGSFYFWGETK